MPIDLRAPDDAQLTWLYALPPHDRAIALTADGALAAIRISAYSPIERLNLAVVATAENCAQLRAELQPADGPAQLDKALPALARAYAVAGIDFAMSTEELEAAYELASQHREETVEYEYLRITEDGHDPDVLIGTHRRDELRGAIADDQAGAQQSERRGRGRPATGRVQYSLTVAPAIMAAFQTRADAHGLTRSEAFEALARQWAGPGQPPLRDRRTPERSTGIDYLAELHHILTALDDGGPDAGVHTTTSRGTPLPNNLLAQMTCAEYLCDHVDGVIASLHAASDDDGGPEQAAQDRQLRALDLMLALNRHSVVEQLAYAEGVVATGRILTLALGGTDTRLHTPYTQPAPSLRPVRKAIRAVTELAHANLPSVLLPPAPTPHAAAKSVLEYQPEIVDLIDILATEQVGGLAGAVTTALETPAIKRELTRWPSAAERLAVLLYRARAF